VSQQPAFPVFCFEGQKVLRPASSFLLDIKLNWRKSHYYQHSRVGLGNDKTILSSSDSFVVFGFSFDVLTQDCKSKFLDPLWCTFRKANKCL